MNVDALCIGEALIAFTPVDRRSIATAQTYDASLAGAEANVAIALASAGVNVQWAGRVGADSFGERVLADLKAHRVGSRFASVVDGMPTGLYIKSRDGGRPLYYRRGSAASEFGTADVEELARSIATRLVHVSGVTAQASPAGLDALRYLIEKRPFGSALLSFDFNYRPSLAQGDIVDEMRNLARLCDVVFVGRDEAASMWGVRTAEDVRELLPEPPSLIVKDADREAVEFERLTVVRAPAKHVEVVEPTGAGDAFAAGWISARLRGRAAAERLESGHSFAADVLRSERDVAIATPLART